MSKMLDQYSTYDPHYCEGPRLCFVPSHPVLNTSNTQAALANMDNDTSPKRAASSFHQGFHGKVLHPDPRQGSQAQLIIQSPSEWTFTVLTVWTS